MRKPLLTVCCRHVWDYASEGPRCMVCGAMARPYWVKLPAGPTVIMGGNEWTALMAKFPEELAVLMQRRMLRG